MDIPVLAHTCTWTRVPTPACKKTRHRTCQPHAGPCALTVPFAPLAAPPHMLPMQPHMPLMHTPMCPWASTLLHVQVEHPGMHVRYTHTPWKCTPPPPHAHALQHPTCMLPVQHTPFLTCTAASYILESQVSTPNVWSVDDAFVLWDKIPFRGPMFDESHLLSTLSFILASPALS